VWEAALVPLRAGRQWVVMNRATMRVHRWPETHEVMGFGEEAGAQACAERLNREEA
jgi:hypothetical protein